jgi:molecular chaperone HscB
VSEAAAGQSKTEAQVDRDYFSLFELTPSPEVDVEDLGERKRRLLRHFHPDRFAAAPGAEKRMAAALSAEINAAFSTLSDPVLRAGYLLQQHGVDLQAAERAPVATMFLMQQMELREQVDEWSGLDSASRTAVADAAERLFAHQWSNFAQAFAQQDWQAGADSWVCLQYVDKLRREIKQRQQD